MADQPSQKRLIAWTAFVAGLLCLIAIGDMIIGRQTLAPLLQAKPEPGVTYHEGTGVTLGKWRLHPGARQSESLGYGIWLTSSGSKLPVEYTRMWAEDGTLLLEAEAFDASGQPVEFYSTTLTDAQLMKLAPHPLVIDRQYAPDGTILSESRTVDGRPAK